MEFGMQFFPDVAPGEKPAAQYFTECLRLVDLADPLGWGHVRTVEHYFHPYGGYSPSPIVFLTAASQPRTQMSPFAPRITTIKINPDKIRDVIGPGGKVIRKIVEETGAQIDIEDDGTVFIASVDQDGARRAIDWIKSLTDEVEIGRIYHGKVVRIMPFGAFVEVLPNQDGLVHISKLTDHRVERVEEVVNVGDEIVVKAVEIDSQGRLNLSRQAAIEELQSKGEPVDERIDPDVMADALSRPPAEPGERRGGRDGRGGRDRDRDRGRGRGNGR